MFPTRKRGEPLVVLGIILIGWVGLRFAFLSLTTLSETPALATQEDVLLAAADEKVSDGSVANATALASPQNRSDEEAAAPADIGAAEVSVVDSPPTNSPVARIRIDQVAERVTAPVLDTPQRDLWAVEHDQAPASDHVQLTQHPDEPPTDTHTTAVSHNLLWMAAMAYVPVPDAVRHQLEQASADASRRNGGADTQPAHSEASGLSRFSVDSWLFLRQDGAALSPGGFTAPSYGRSQAGAVARYRLRPSSPFAPHAYARLTQALAGPKDRDVAIGLSAIPLANMPVRAHVEARVSEQAGRTEVRPAAFVTSGFERHDLPFGGRLSFYGQAGYVGGDFATGFVDGSLKVTRDLAKFDLGSLSAGGGVWGGAQNGASRLDVGPSANVDMRFGDVPARLSVDYRVRVAGDAQPGSGVAVTLSTGF